MRRTAVTQTVTGATSASDRIEDVYRRHGHKVWRAVLAFSGSPDIASDAVSEAFAQALRRGAAIEAPLPWIWRTAMHLAAGALKDRGGVDAGTGTPERSYDLPEAVADLV